jgi:hypothetical protein
MTYGILREKYQRNEVDNVFLRAFSVSKSISNNIYFFLLQMNLPTDKKSLMKDSPTEHFRR